MKFIECSRCVLNNHDDETISFNQNGICNYCLEYDATAKKYSDGEKNKQYLERKLTEIKERGKSKEFDSILGLSGGVDSSYLAYWAKQQGLNPLIVHFDNGWNSELAINNIENICKNLNLQLHTIVIDWEEFKELQLAYLKAGVVDIECASDHAIIATLYNLAYQYKIHYILAGVNYQTENIMPKNWNYSKQDYTNLKNINRQFGKLRKFKSYPTKPFLKQMFYRYIFKVEFVEFLNYLPYEKNEVKKFIAEKLGWRDYGGKHYESQFTKIYQSYILPSKFKVDKRKAHLSNLICSGQITKEEAKKELASAPFDSATIEGDIEYLVKKWGITRKEFNGIMQEKPRRQADFGSDNDIYKFFSSIKRKLHRKQNIS